jgi:hypothetical protein
LTRVSTYCGASCAERIAFALHPQKKAREDSNDYKSKEE